MARSGASLSTTAIDGRQQWHGFSKVRQSLPGVTVRVSCISRQRGGTPLSATPPSCQIGLLVSMVKQGEPWMAKHIGMPFGAAASGIAWHKVGRLLQRIACKLLGIPMLRYVDDYFAVDRSEYNARSLPVVSFASHEAGNSRPCPCMLRAPGAGSPWARLSV